MADEKNIIPSPRNIRQRIYLEIAEERGRQDSKWGGAAHDDEHTMLDWYALLDYRVELLPSGTLIEDRKCLIQVAALAIAALESLERKAEAAKVETPAQTAG